MEYEKIGFGDRVKTERGDGMVTELDGLNGEYLVYGRDGQLGWLTREELTHIQ